MLTYLIIHTRSLTVLSKGNEKLNSNINIGTINLPFYKKRAISYEAMKVFISSNNLALTNQSRPESLPNNPPTFLLLFPFSYTTYSFCIILYLLMRYRDRLVEVIPKASRNDAVSDTKSYDFTLAV